MYGSPHADFIITGTVESAATNTPIPDIIVEMRKINLMETGFSNSVGNYNLIAVDYPGDKTYQIKFTDTDGALNGEFETLDTTIVFSDPKYTDGDGSWYRGVTKQELNVKLRPKK